MYEYIFVYIVLPLIIIMKVLDLFVGNMCSRIFFMYISSIQELVGSTPFLGHPVCIKNKIKLQFSNIVFLDIVSGGESIVFNSRIMAIIQENEHCNTSRTRVVELCDSKFYCKSRLVGVRKICGLEESIPIINFAIFLLFQNDFHLNNKELQYLHIFVFRLLE
jgi:hypothetical protein